jgi:pyruvate dehydrogenase E2 component (dihydrolipoamide acetyltransferase)
LIVLIEASGAAATAAPTPKVASPTPAAAPSTPVPQAAAPAPVVSSIAAAPAASGKSHASPAIRRFARELGVDLTQVKGSGDKGRVTKDDLQNFVKQSLAQPRAASSGGSLPGLLPWPEVDFAKYGAVESKPLSRIKKISGANLHRNWVMIPHVTQFEEADISEMEAFRKQLGAEYAKQNIKITPLAFLLKAAAATLKHFPDFNASLDASGENLIVKKYIHIGVAVDTPDGLMVPVLRDVDQKGIVQLAKELGEISAKARDKKLTAADMQGGCFTISSLGGIGGTAFTPIINAPEVAILGVSRSSMKPVYQDGEFVPRLMLPLSLSYDHRVIDGAAGARFTTYLAHVLSDMRRLAL